MKYESHIKPISFLKSHAAEIIKTIQVDREPLVITQNGEAKLVVMDIKSYDEQQQTLALLKILALGQKDIKEGLYRSAQDVLNDLDKDN
ncbi:antitoxin [Gammaproteobacteria bacterium]|nr:antitoxin [Gammaproteobacteria bacterium]